MYCPNCLGLLDVYIPLNLPKNYKLHVWDRMQNFDNAHYRRFLIENNLLLCETSLICCNQILFILFEKENKS